MFVIAIPVSAVDPVSYIVEQSGDGSATWSTTQIHSGSDSLYIDTGPMGVPTGWGKIAFMMPEGTTLGDIDTMSWYYFLEVGYPPHVDIYLDHDLDGTVDDCLTFEYANNCENPTVPPTYGAMTGDWYATFSDDGTGLAVVDDSAIAWPHIGGNLELHTLADWKAGTPPGDIDANTPVIQLQFQMHADLIQSKAYIDDVEINGVTYDLESSGIDMTATIVNPIVSISVDKTNIDFETIIGGKTSAPHTVTITSTSTTGIVLSASVNEDGSFYNDHLELEGGSVSTWTATIDEGGPAAMVEVVLVVPIGTPPGTYTGTLVFMATPPPPTP